MEGFEDDFDDEAGMEIQGLQAIFDTDLEIKGKSPWKISVKITPTTDAKKNHVSVKLNVTLPPEYPEEVPQIIVELDKGLNTHHREVLQKLLADKALECVGMGMMFDVTEAAKEYLQKHNEVEKSEHELMVERMSKKTAKASMEDLAKSENKAKNEYISSLEWVVQNSAKAVTRENFEIWKKKFDAEGNKNTTIIFEVKKASKTSGREIFEKDLKLGTGEPEAKAGEVFYFNATLYEDDDLDDLEEEEVETKK